MTHDYQLDWWALASRGIPGWSPADCPAEVCVTPGHGLHTRGDELQAARYPHLFLLDIESMTLRVRPAGQLAWT